MKDVCMYICVHINVYMCIEGGEFWYQPCLTPTKCVPYHFAKKDDILCQGGRRNMA